MNIIFYIIVFALTLVAIGWQFYSLKKIAARKFTSDYCLLKSGSSTGWKRFFIPTVFLIISLIPPVNHFLVVVTLAFYLSIVADQWWFSKYKYQYLILQGSNLISNRFKIKTFNLEELTSIGFLPWSDSFRLNFQNGQSLSIQRGEFENDSLNEFLKKSISLSQFNVAIHEDAKSKMYSD